MERQTTITMSLDEYEGIKDRLRELEELRKSRVTMEEHERLKNLCAKIMIDTNLLIEINERLKRIEKWQNTSSRLHSLSGFSSNKEEVK